MASFADTLMALEDHELDVRPRRVVIHGSVVSSARIPCSHGMPTTNARVMAQVCGAPLAPADASALYTKMMMLYVIQNDL